MLTASGQIETNRGGHSIHQGCGHIRQAGCPLSDGTVIGNAARHAKRWATLLVGKLESNTPRHVPVVAVTRPKATPAGSDSLPEWLQLFKEGLIEDLPAIESLGGDSAQEEEPEAPPLAKKSNESKPTSKGLLTVQQIQTCKMTKTYLANRRTPSEKSVNAQFKGPIIPFGADMFHKQRSSSSVREEDVAWQNHGVRPAYRRNMVRRVAHCRLGRPRKEPRLTSKGSTPKKYKPPRDGNMCIFYVLTDESNKKEKHTKREATA